MAWLAERVHTAAGGPVSRSAAEEAWITARFTKVCVQVTSEEELRALDARARERGVLCRLIVDSGRAEFGDVPTATCLAVGPAPAAEVDAITGHLSLYCLPVQGSATTTPRATPLPMFPDEEPAPTPLIQTLALFAPYVLILILTAAGVVGGLASTVLPVALVVTGVIAVLDRRRATAAFGHRQPQPSVPEEEYQDLGAPFDAVGARFDFARVEEAPLRGLFQTRSRELLDQVRVLDRVVKRSDAVVLLLGPTGTGKSSLARAIHECVAVEQKRTGPLVELNGMNLGGDQGMSKLVGHVEGAFTGAVGRRKGALLEADGGSILIDEVGDLPMDAQVRLITLLDSFRFSPLGTEALVACDVRVIAATSRDLHKLAAEGRFRLDLLERISPWTIVMPPLSARLDDLDASLPIELAVLSKRYNRNVTMTPEAQELWLRYCKSKLARWPANFRSFGQAVEQLATLAPGDEIDVATVEERIAARTAAARAEDERSGVVSVDLEALLGSARLRKTCHIERVNLIEVVTICRRAAHQTAAAREIYGRDGEDSNSESTKLRRFLARYGLTYAQVVAR